MKLLIRAALLASVILAAACSKDESAETPPPVATAPDATGHYCGMLLAEHAGPKGQILLASGDTPVWFTSVRDTFTFLSLPEEPKDVAAVYVSDMGKAPSWEKPGDTNWILADRAVYVIESDQTGGMGGAEAVPFGDEAAATSFIAAHGGRIVALDDAKAAMAETPLN
jgi:copper chaperone NosL